MADLIPDKEPQAKRPQEKKAPKKKEVKVSLQEFQASGGGAWADEPVQESSGGGRYDDNRGSGRSDDRYGGGDRSDRKYGGGFSGGGDRHGGGDRYGGGGDRHGGGDRFGGGGDRYGGGDRQGGGERQGGGDRYGGGDRDRGGGAFGDRRGRDDDRDSGRPRRDDRPPREPVPVPENPPFVAYVGNLTFDVTEEEISEFFGQCCKVKNVRIIKESDTGKPKGFGYVEFEDKDSLIESLAANGQSLCNREIRVDVAEQKASREGQVSEADKNDWRRGDRLPPAPERERDRPRDGDRDRPRDGDRDRPRDGDRDRPRDGDRDRPRDEGPFGGRRAPREQGSYNSGGGERHKVVLAPPSKPRRDEPPPAVDYSKAKINPFGQAKPRDEVAIMKKLEEQRIHSSQAKAENTGAKEGETANRD